MKGVTTIGMNTINTNLKRKIAILNVATFMLVLLLTTLIYGFCHIHTKSVTETKHQLEETWRNEALDKSEYLSQQLELAITKNQLNYWDDTELHKWAEEQLLPMKVGGELSNVILVNIGYSIRNWDDMNWLTAQDEIELPISSDLSKEISEHFTGLNFLGKSNMEVKNYITDYAEHLSVSHSEINKKLLISAIERVLFVKNKIIMDTTPSNIMNTKFSNTRFLEDYLLGDNDHFETNLEKIQTGSDSWRLEDTSLTVKNETKWLEWSVVPPNKLGWDQESPHKDGISNVCYKKIAIIVEVAEDEIYKPYHNVFATAEFINLVGLLSIPSLALTSLIILFISFYKYLKSEK